MMKFKALTIIFILLITATSFAYVIQGSSTQPVMNGDITDADAKAREQALLNALKNYFDRLQSDQPDKEIPDVTTEFFKFIKSYKIADRGFANDTVTYTVLADVDDVALNDLTYFVQNAVNTVVYNISGVPPENSIDNNIEEAFKEYKFDIKHQSGYQASLRENSTKSERVSTFKASQSQYFMEMSVVREPAGEGECTVILTTETHSKTREFTTLKTKSHTRGDSEEACVASAVSLSLVKTLGYVRTNFIPLPAGETVLSKFNVIAKNYANFAVPKKLMDELKKRSFIDSYKITSFAGSKLDIEVTTYVDIDVLIKKLQSIEEEYGFSARKDDMTNILLDFAQ
ncbi:hypothetical protein Dacet_1862 [Denitrovibrio acetiphilus DSM 12809]|uniref:Uncharacterized protein n=1 Tax=Denitrovibrio acetiphilus (strain DSM 12809 / NBRC 114555 / N2460) TaxID=522772 RepID=D4H0W3_DENA2|nr:hypothetical protein [Denitrovibrio acetiphilus]ADD68626.1 hypothetical protein Dacet_1862 [Denitrovibrio acetiphilus DSM 12809]